MVEDRVPPPGPAPVPGAPPGARMTTSDPAAVQTVGERARSLYPNTVGMRDNADEAPPPVPGTAPQPQDPAVANYSIPLPPDFQADEASLGELKALAVEHKLAPEVAGKLVGL